MTLKPIKEEIISLIEELPDDATLEDIQYHLFVKQKLLRAEQQIKEGKKVDKLSSAEKGDLAFFIDANGKINHVGILDGNGSIIHSSGWVKIELLTEEGIINKETGKRTHQLHSIKSLY